MNSYKEISKSIIAINGSTRLSEFRLSSLQNKLGPYKEVLRGMSCNEVYFLSVKESPNSKDLDLLEKVLKMDTFSLEDGLSSLVVIPRRGTISPWSSKATEILKNSGLHLLNRIERGFFYKFENQNDFEEEDLKSVGSLLSDRMTQDVLTDLEESKNIFSNASPKEVSYVDVHNKGRLELKKANLSLGLALSDDEISYLYDNYKGGNSNPTDAELMMFAQANSEHCRHKIFNADWKIDSINQQESLFDMIRNTYKLNSEGVLSAYEDNAAIIKGYESERFYPSGPDEAYKYQKEPVHLVIKVETHNHPTAISPFSGAATGSGGEIRDEGATGIGAKPKAGLSGFSVSNLRIPGLEERWEKIQSSPSRIATPLQIMIQAPLGAAAFNNEFGRPNTLGYFRSFEQTADTGEGQHSYGYHKPIMLAGGLGNIKPEHVNKLEVPVGSKLVVLGGPAMLIGLGGGSASSVSSGEGDSDLDFASVQRENPEMERRCQEVLDRCWQKGSNNPILFIHDVGAGGLSNAVPELVKDSGHGGLINLRNIPNAEPGMSPMEIWCNESQERYVIAIDESSEEIFTQLCQRERCPFAVIGEITEGKILEVYDEEFENYPISLSLDVLFGKAPKTARSFSNRLKIIGEINLSKENIEELFFEVLRHPTVASKNFLITIGDRTVTGLIARDQLVGPWQVPVSDHSISRSSFVGKSGEAMSIGERSPCAILNPAASARISVAEAVTNILPSGVSKLSDIRLSANWMGSPGRLDGDQDLFEAVEAIGMNLCPEWGITIPVGKDSLSMATDWTEDNTKQSVISPLSLVISAFAPLEDIGIAVTPQLLDKEDTELLFIDLAKGKNRLGGSIASQINNILSGEVPDVECVSEMPVFVEVFHDLLKEKKIIACHDRSDGGLITAIAEMSFAGRVGVDISIEEISKDNQDLVGALFNEELGVVIQINSRHKESITSAFKKCGLDNHTFTVGRLNKSKTVRLNYKEECIYDWSIEMLLKHWSRVGFEIQSLRDNPTTAEEEYRNDIDTIRKGISPKIKFPFPGILNSSNKKPSLAILREQGVNGQVEMAAAFDRAGFSCVDVHMTDLISGKQDLQQFKGLVACGGFSYGDVLGAGGGWAANILHNDSLRNQFSKFFSNEEVFSLGVCNGCQTLALLTDLIPGSKNWPKFVNNTSEKFESRLVQTVIRESPSILFKDMIGSVLPVPVAHGEGKTSLTYAETKKLVDDKLSPMLYADDEGSPTESYPQNPNGSLLGVAAITNASGRVTLMMPHPERAFLNSQYSWSPEEWEEYGPWIKMFMNAREFSS